MKRAFVIILAALVLGAATYFLCFRMATLPMRQMASVENELVWLAAEFQLTLEQTKRVEQLHSAYEPRCMEMCRKIAENNAQLDKLIADGREFTPDMDRLLRASAEIQTECRREMLTQIYAVAAVMPPEQGARYIGLLKMQVLQPAHRIRRPPPSSTRMSNAVPDADMAAMLRLRGGDDLALNELMTRWQQPLVRYLYRYTLCEADALDLAQDTFVRVYEHRAQYDARGKFSTWLYAIATNLCRNHARWKSRHPTVSMEAELSASSDTTLGEQLPDAKATPAQSAQTHELAGAVRDAIQTLPDDSAPPRCSTSMKTPPIQTSPPCSAARSKPWRTSSTAPASRSVRNWPAGSDSCSRLPPTAELSR